MDAARRIDGLQNRFFLDALLRGRYPEDVLADLEPYDLGVRDGDLAIIGGPIDMLGINYYNRFIVTGREGAAPAITSPFALGRRDRRGAGRGTRGGACRRQSGRGV